MYASNKVLHIFIYPTGDGSKAGHVAVASGAKIALITTKRSSCSILLKDGRKRKRKEFEILFLTRQS